MNMVYDEIFRNFTMAYLKCVEIFMKIIWILEKEPHEKWKMKNNKNTKVIAL